MEKELFDSLIARVDFIEFLKNNNIGSTENISFDRDRTTILNPSNVDLYFKVVNGNSLTEIRVDVISSDEEWKYDLLESNTIKIEEEIKESKLSFDIDYWSYNITYDQLSRLFESGKIIVPNMQRGYVWDHVQASKLIESIIMGLPLPSLFLIKQADGKYLVVDGLQRITTIGSFRYNMQLPNQDKESGFKLKGVNSKINNKTYSELASSEETKGLLENFDMGTINVIEFKQSSPKYEEAMYFLFERLNSGGTSLSEQQIRNSISYGPFNEKLNSIAEKELSHLFSKKACENLAPSELLLRSIAIYDLINEDSDELEPKNIVYKTLLNNTAEKYHMEYKIMEYKFRSTNTSNMNFESSNEYKTYMDKVDKIFDEIVEVFDKTKEFFGEDAYKRKESGEVKNRLSPTLFEATTVTLLLYKNSLAYRDKKTLMNLYDDIFSLKQVDDITLYETHFTQATGLISNIRGRIDTMKKVLFKND